MYSSLHFISTHQTSGFNRLQENNYNLYYSLRKPKHQCSR